jgi:hypothetical protein
LTPAFLRPVSQSDARALQYRTGSGIAFLFIPERHSGIDKKVHPASALQTEGSGKLYTLHVCRRLLLVLLVL